ncbi:MAG TPA: helicase C-terminal domain-containing protein [Bacillota bacterium]|nr:helicase C-terminal domain-containing protein [Bacillota bacterium]
MAEQDVRVSVGDLLSIDFHQSDLGGGDLLSVRFQEGIQGHQLLRNRRGPDYQTEVPLKFSYHWEDYCLIVRGRMDGVIETDSTIVIEEIKTTYLALATLELAMFQVHEAQLQLYLYFMQTLHPEKTVTGRLTYLNLEDLAEKSFSVTDNGKELFEKLAIAFLTARREQDRWLATRNASLQNWAFPFTQRRTGQDELMQGVTQAITEGRDLFVEAATGIGKTVAVLYPALQKLAAGERFNRIFFLTAKTVGKEILKKTLQQAATQGIRLRTVFIEAKERVCLLSLPRCDTENCPYAHEYFRKVKPVLPEVLCQELVTPELLIKYAREYTVCPFELSLDLSLQADLIVGDYNYLFDPGVYLRRFFAEGNRDHLFLIDEAHNLVNRGREMYSADLGEADLFRLESLLSNTGQRLPAAVRTISAFFNAWRDEMEDNQQTGIRLNHLPEFLEPDLQRLIALINEHLNEHPRTKVKEDLLPIYFKLVSFTRIAQMVNRDYAIFVITEQDKLKLRLLCLNPGKALRRRLDGGWAAVFFSATLSPRQYFQELLGGKPDALWIRLTSPFPRENRLYLHIPELDTRYRARAQSTLKLAQYIADMVTAHTGNYLVFFPSYSYLQSLQPFIKQLLVGKATVFVQSSRMSEADKQQFLDCLARTGGGRSQLGLAVLGGVFGEGVDLPGDALVGVMIVGPGLPMVNEEQELIREYFDERDQQGFFYAYLVPGLIRVIQSAGRVFRRPEDRGVVLLVDDRFADERYQELLPPDWFVPGRPFSNPDYREALAKFWDE